MVRCKHSKCGAFCMVPLRSFSSAAILILADGVFFLGTGTSEGVPVIAQPDHIEPT